MTDIESPLGYGKKASDFPVGTHMKGNDKPDQPTTDWVVACMRGKKFWVQVIKQDELLPESPLINDEENVIIDNKKTKRSQKIAPPEPDELAKIPKPDELAKIPKPDELAKIPKPVKEKKVKEKKNVKEKKTMAKVIDKPVEKKEDVDKKVEEKPKPKPKSRTKKLHPVVIEEHIELDIKPPKEKRAPSKYNLFIKEKIAELKAKDPTQKPTNLMKEAVMLWNAQKI